MLKDSVTLKPACMTSQGVVPQFVNAETWGYGISQCSISEPSWGTVARAAHPVGPEEHGAEEAAVDGGLVHHEGVLLVVAAVAGDGHNCVLASRQLPVTRRCCTIAEPQMSLPKPYLYAYQLLRDPYCKRHQY